MAADVTEFPAPFRVGDTVRMKGVPAGVADVVVKGIEECPTHGTRCSLGVDVIVYDDPETGEPDEAHASSFDLVKRAQ